MKRTISLALLFLLGASLAIAQKPAARQTFVLNLDYAKFRNNDSSGYLEIYYGFYPSLITYGNRNGHRLGVLKVHTRVIDERSGQYRTNVLSTVLVPAPDSQQVTNRMVSISQAGHTLPFGDYRLDYL